MLKLKAPKGKIIIKVDLESKNTHRFIDGTELRLERGVENFNRRETQPVNGIVIDGEWIPENAQIVIHHNALHDTYRIFNYQSPTEQNLNIRYYSIPDGYAFFWKMPGEINYKPCINFAFALKVYKPYKGALQITPAWVKRRLYLLTGEYEGKACITLNAVGYPCIFQGDNGREETIIVCRNYESRNLDMDRQEIISQDPYVTDKIISGEYLVGQSAETAITLKKYLDGKN